ncbi:hypothetical protein Ancab_014978 [Ancistrocladus abbreviatus]
MVDGDEFQVTIIEEAPSSDKDITNVVSFSFNQSSSPSFVRDSFNSTGKVQEKDLAMEDTSLEDNQSVPCKNVFRMAVGLSTKPKENHEKLLIADLLEGSQGFGYCDKVFKENANAVEKEYEGCRQKFE